MKYTYTIEMDDPGEGSLCTATLVGQTITGEPFSAQGETPWLALEGLARKMADWRSGGSDDFLNGVGALRS